MIYDILFEEKREKNINLSLLSLSIVIVLTVFYLLYLFIENRVCYYCSFV